MSASLYNFNIEKGTSFKLNLVYKDSSGNIINITDYCARLTWTTDTGITTTFVSDNLNLSQYKFTIDGPLGLISLLFPATTTDSFNFSNARYDLELQSDTDLYVGGGKETHRLLFGSIDILDRASDINSTLVC